MKNSSKILVAAAAGIAAGSVLGTLYAPAKGTETREKLDKEIRKLSDVFHGKCSIEKLNKVKGKLEMHKEQVEKAIQKINSKIVDRLTETPNEQKVQGIA
jgi:gas vesicle protein